MNIVQLNMFDCKRCRVCGQVKHKDEFNKYKTTRDGLNTICRECGKRQSREYYTKNKEATLEKLKRDYAESPKRRQYNQEYRKNNPDKIREYKRTDIRRNVESIKRNRAAVAHRRRVRLYNGGGNYTAKQWKQLCDWFGNICLCCGVTDHLSVDHVIPVRDGGSNNIDNLQCLCLNCNRKKNAKTIDYRDPGRLSAFLEHIS